VIADPMALLMAPGDVSEDEEIRKVAMAADIVARTDSEFFTGHGAGSVQTMKSRATDTKEHIRRKKKDSPQKYLSKRCAEMVGAEMVAFFGAMPESA